MNIRTVIFDLDGTLVDSIEGIACSMNNVLSSHGFPVHDIEAYKTLVGNGIRVLVKRALPADAGGEAELDRYHFEMLAEYAQHWDYRMKAYNGVEELLEFLDGQRISCAVDTNKDESVSRLIVERFFPGFPFFRVAGSKPGVPHKPDPARAVSIAAQTGVSPGQCIYLGDSEIDVMTAKNAGMVQVSAAWGFRKRADLLSAGAGYIIDKPLELIDLIKKI